MTPPDGAGAPSELSGPVAPSSRRFADTLPIALLFVALLLLLLPITALENLRDSFTLYLFFAGGSTLLLYGACHLFERRNIAVRRRDLVAGAILLRLALLPMSPSLSDDAYRYLWDGRLLLHGLTPYRSVPADSTLASYHDELYRRQGYPTTPTIYPPGAQILFAGGVTLGELCGDGYRAGYFALKGVFLLFEIGAIWLLAGILQLMEIPLRRGLLYAWHPLVLIELAGQGHTDALWVFAIAMAVYGYLVRRGEWWGAGLAFGGAMRLHPLTAVPLWLRFAPKRSYVAALLVSLPFLVIFGALLDPVSFANYTGVLARFTNYYEFNGGFYYGLKWMLDMLGIAPSNRIAGAIATVLQLVLFAAIWLIPPRDRSVATLIRRLLLLLTVQLVLPAKVHPWYFVAPLFLLPMIPRSPLRRAWLWAALVAPLTYIGVTLMPFREPLWVLWTEWGIFGLLVIVDWWREKGKPPGLESPDGFG